MSKFKKTQSEKEIDETDWPCDNVQVEEILEIHWENGSEIAV